MGIADPNSERPKMPPRYIDLKREILPQDEESRKKLVNAWNALLVKMKGAVDGFKEKGSNVCLSSEYVTVLLPTVTDRSSRKWSSQT